MAAGRTQEEVDVQQKRQGCDVTVENDETVNPQVCSKCRIKP